MEFVTNVGFVVSRDLITSLVEHVWTWVSWALSAESMRARGICILLYADHDSTTGDHSEPSCLVPVSYRIWKTFIQLISNNFN